MDFRIIISHISRIVESLTVLKKDPKNLSRYNNALRLLMELTIILGNEKRNHISPEVKEEIRANSKLLVGKHTTEVYSWDTRSNWMRKGKVRRNRNKERAVSTRSSAATKKTRMYPA